MGGCWKDHLFSTGLASGPPLGLGGMLTCLGSGEGDVVMGLGVH